MHSTSDIYDLENLTTKLSRNLIALFAMIHKLHVGLFANVLTRIITLVS